MDEAEYCDRVGLMVAGRLAALGTPRDLKREFVPGRMLEVHGGVSVEDLQQATAGLPLLGIEHFGAALRLRVADDGPRAGDVRSALESHGHAGAYVRDADVTLEDVFVRAVRDEGAA
jgi:ABC-2 type transport system ATP-binding protein